MRPGYAVEYDYLPPTQLTPALQTKRIEGLFVAGPDQRHLGLRGGGGPGPRGRHQRGALGCAASEPLVLSRSEAYIGVLIDDLVTLGTDEPYRMFTSRAEYRLSLRHDTADLRLVPHGHAAGLQPDAALERRRAEAPGHRGGPRAAAPRRVRAEDERGGGRRRSRARIGARPSSRRCAIRELALATLARLEPALAAVDRSWRELAELEVKYEGYVRHQEEQVGRARALEALRIPPTSTGPAAPGLSSEAREKLAADPAHLVGQASRVPGVRQADLAVLLVLLRKKRP